MIEMASFEKGMGVLAERFRSAMDADAQKGYYAILSEELSTDDFRVAVKLAFRHSQFWPSPQQLIDFVRPSRNLEVEAGEMFQRVRALSEAAPGHGIGWRRDKVEELGAATLYAFDVIGANERLRSMSGRDFPHCRRDFIEAYVEASRRTEAELQIAAARKTLEAPRTGPQFDRKIKPALIGGTVSAVVASVTREVPA